MRAATRSMSRWLGEAVAFWVAAANLLFAQAQNEENVFFYGGSEFQLLRFHRGYVPPLLAAGLFGGVRWEALKSGTTYRAGLWGEARLTYARGAILNPLFPGLSGGIALRAGLPDPSRHYGQVLLGMDAYAFNIADGGGTFIRDSQVRPILSFEVGSFAFAEAVFLRYSTYPIPGTTTKHTLTIGIYVQ